MKKGSMPVWSPIIRLLEHGEVPLFKQHFRHWPEVDSKSLVTIASKSWKSCAIIFVLCRFYLDKKRKTCSLCVLKKAKVAFIILILF